MKLIGCNIASDLDKKSSLHAAIIDFTLRKPFSIYEKKLILRCFHPAYSENSIPYKRIYLFNVQDGRKINNFEISQDSVLIYKVEYLFDDKLFLVLVSSS